MTNRISTNYKKVAKYSLYLLAMIILSNARTNGGVAPFGLGWLVGLVYCNQSLLALAPMYIVSMMIVSPSLVTLLSATSPIVILLAVKGLHHLFHRKMRMWHINIYAFIAQIPMIVIGFRELSSIVATVSTVILSQIFTYTTSSFLHATLVRGIKYKYRLDEVAAGMVLLVGIGMGLFGVDILGFRPFYTVLALTIPLCASIAGPLAPLCIGAMMCLGAGIMTGNLMMLGGIIIIAITLSCFIKHNYYLGLAVYALVDLFAGGYFNAFGQYNYMHALAVAIGLVIAACIPPKTRAKIRNIYFGYSDNFSSREYIDNNRREVHNQLLYISNILVEMSDILLAEHSEPLTKVVVVDKLAGTVSAEFCSSCPNLNTCMKALGGDTSNAFKDLVSIAVEGIEVTIDQVNPFLSSRCNRIVGLLSKINHTVLSQSRKSGRDNQLSIGRQLVGEQLGGVGGVIKDLAIELKKPLSYDGAREKTIIDELGCKNILITDIIVSNIGCGCKLTLSIRDTDIANPLLLKVIDKIMGFKMEIIGKSPSRVTGFVYLTLADMPRLGLCYAIANRPYQGNSASGDSFSVSYLDNHKVLIALSDGMGTGAIAHYNSSTTINMIESFYKAGLNNNTILSMVNNLLSAYNSENFCCLDLAIMDLNSGICDFIKLGAVTTTIKRGDEHFYLAGGALPLGIIEDAEPYIERKILFSNDIFAMVSDGILDSIGENGITILLDKLAEANPQVIADSILEQALRVGGNDDSTVIIGKIFTKH